MSLKRRLAESAAAKETNGKASRSGGKRRKNGRLPTAGPDICNAVSDGRSMLPLAMAQILESIRTATDEWPRRVGPSLFVHESDRIDWIESPAALLGYIGSQTGRPPRFIRSEDCHTREDVFAEFRRTARRYKSVELLPHEPPIDGHYYACDVPEAGDGQALAGLIDRFTPATDIDRDLLLAAVVTTFWGGAGGSRPAFVITSDDGRGSGKTTFSMMISHLAGGAIDLANNESAEIVKQRLLSPDGLTKRVVLLDNVKTLKFSWAELESLITAPTISGKRLYFGEATRPNNLLWLVTLNGVSLATDMSQRAVIVKLSRPKHSGNWAEHTREYIDFHRRQIIDDCIGFLRSPPFELEKFSRWGAWERDVLSRLPDPSEAQTVISERQRAADVEEEESDIIEDYFRQQLAALRYSPDSGRVFIPSQIAMRWFNDATNDRCTATAVSRRLKQKISEGAFRCLQVSLSRSYGRGFLWIGEKSDDAEPTDAGIETRIQARERF